MQKFENEILYSASDLVNFLECEHLTALDLVNLESPLEKTKDSDEAVLIQQKGLEHEARYLANLKAKAGTFADISLVGNDLLKKIMATREAMMEGVDLIFQATLGDGPLFGHADFLRRVPTSDASLPLQYEVLDTKLARSPKAKFVVQLAFYSMLLAKTTGAEPQHMLVVLGDGREITYRYADYKYYFASLLGRFLARVNNHAFPTYPEPRERCGMCRWRELCEKKRAEDDHLCQVAGITKIQIGKLRDTEIGTLAKLAMSDRATIVPRLAQPTFEKLRSQASLQYQARETGSRHYELLAPERQSAGFARLPMPDAGDLYFDMEGDPLEEGGLEYLFGIMYRESGGDVFKPFWAHSRADEKLAFEAFLDFVVAHLAKFPRAHIYHYAAYETTALKRLMSLHGTREATVDNLLRMGKFVDLYKVVREGLRVSEPGYSIKNIEHFYLGERKGDVKSAGASIVFYENWKQSGNQELLDAIAAYNRDDVFSTLCLHKWLLELRPDELPWATPGKDDDDKHHELGALTEAEQQLIPYFEQLVKPLPDDRLTWSTHDSTRELTYQLLDFHRRTAKPEWWAMFARQEMVAEELIEDGECLGGLVMATEAPPTADKRSLVYTYEFPEQETKMRTGTSSVCVENLAKVNDLVVDEETRRVTFRYSAKKDALPISIGLGPAGPIKTEALQMALFRFADSVIANDKKYPAIKSVLARDLPRIAGHPAGAQIVSTGNNLLAETIRAVENLDGSHLFIQGPPGAGKTYTGARVIVALLKRGFRVGVSSNSHKAVHNLLEEVERVAEEEGHQFRGVKKASSGKEDTEFNSTHVETVYTNDEIVEGVTYQLIAGTAWLFAAEGLDQALDYIFVDEAGQVALANLIAMGTSARNIVLLGDQMQLGQPVKGTHPGRSGESTLDYLLDGAATIPEVRGVFLGTTWRMHPNVCKFISDAVYDGRLEAEGDNARRELVLNKSAHRMLRSSGIRVVSTAHDGCSQRSVEEAEVIRELVENLLTQQYADKKGVLQPIELNNILVVAPFNMQVNLLKQVLPAGARVGTVDKFQGQEAEVVIISMTTSSGDYLPRFIEFLYSKNRLNVAISRAKCLTLLVISPALLSIECGFVEEMALVNTLCWVREYAELQGIGQADSTCKANRITEEGAAIVS